VVVASLTREHVAGAGAPALVAAPGDELPAAALATLGFTAREGEAARLLARRMTNAELAATLGVSAHTARHHTERVMQKLGVRSRREIVTALLSRTERRA
jgi:DNA-binding CsgD family transcriptional regulator